MENKPEWQQQAEKLAELYGASFVIFRNGMEPECLDPTKVVLLMSKAKGALTSQEKPCGRSTRWHPG
ncbi:hypothetical protein [Klebsiella aerogenes]|uniref:hypothetical protein n=1 Tax=Klebsiella aerogenes TaxID=548 RepID=UPI00249B0FD9|nr:hypothetical protein [Klebsiella aerogenes]MDI2670676.1 hypothetical protein [Klebsiella aerogenes]MDI2709302.1 hypothetical protein [Klebsiella aerogenes]MDI2802172.1 hypothetical protein [Klebsiella aerogenes]